MCRTGREEKKEPFVGATAGGDSNSRANTTRGLQDFPTEIRVYMALHISRNKKSKLIKICNGNIPLSKQQGHGSQPFKNWK